MADTLAYIPEVIQSHFDDAAFLYSEFLLESTSVKPDNDYLPEVEERLHANLDGLQINIGAAWPLCEEALAQEDAGAFFIAAYLAFHTGELDKVKMVVEVSKSEQAHLQAVGYALAWHPWQKSGFWAEKFIAAKSLPIVWIGHFCFTAHQQTAPVSTSHLLEKTLAENERSVSLNLLSAIHQNHDRSVLSVLQNFHSDDLDELYFQVLKARVALQDSSAIGLLKPFVLTENDNREEAIAIAFSFLEKQEAKQWVAELKQLADSERWMLLAIAELNEQALLPWVIKQMEIPHLSRIAGHVFSRLSSFDLRQKGWILDDEQLDKNWLDFEGDEELDWPDVVKIKQVMSLKN
jgi:uncharacterized protein (TIGR02270 family)